mmetsp:Transcript_72513/g.109418  ORF Transcript_72513/g.109418 Transcript_72513/m.109418 type:complete len:379 (-) Transcript_72513:164-1300(-)|eukprot:CAMPEP_0117026766 /NCGR_PEP_ID=MMETSP0472-20121206/19646_1 /TAXON_ID=693140 ORGANISM="Tiarina fusus, Strain LIS" /NCGR_SAMPLE_ID=MMETSP0472 /ASSEMBLY_ACC=CAM_ASM_000603 /LENGTH=378 /DNA_ID=CAMNT_0004733863 /DNA_START=135 /DNA_END=1271 /DNA_ORIENTATION=+
MTIVDPPGTPKLEDEVGDGPAQKEVGEAASKDKAGTSDDDLDALAELVPDLKTRKQSLEHATGEFGAAADADGEPPVNRMDSLGVQDSNKEKTGGDEKPNISQEDYSDSSSDGFDGKNVEDVLYGTDEKEDVNSEQALSSDHSKPRPPGEEHDMGLGEDFQNMSSGQSLSTATQTHEVRMPMYLPTFKPATGCTNASDFIVRCFVARLRSGITVVKHGRSRWCKSRLRILHIHPDGRSLSWKPAQGEPTSSKRPPKLDLTTCLEVRHAWSPDPQNPMYTGTPILRQKCEAANAHKSFALIFPKRTVDITSVTADQCKVLMEGFSALCFRLQVAELAGKGNKAGAQKMPEEEEVATTASVTLTNNSTLSPHNRQPHVPF